MINIGSQYIEERLVAKILYTTIVHLGHKPGRPAQSELLMIVVKTFTGYKGPNPPNIVSSHVLGTREPQDKYFENIIFRPQGERFLCVLILLINNGELI